MKNYRNVISLVWTVVLLCCPKSEGACSDRDFTISMWNFVQCVENNYNSLMNDENDQCKLDKYLITSKIFLKSYHLNHI